MAWDAGARADAHGEERSALRRLPLRGLRHRQRSQHLVRLQHRRRERQGSALGGPGRARCSRPWPSATGRRPGRSSSSRRPLGSRVSGPEPHPRPARAHRPGRVQAAAVRRSALDARARAPGDLRTDGGPGGQDPHPGLRRVHPGRLRPRQGPAAGDGHAARRLTVPSPGGPARRRGSGGSRASWWTAAGWSSTGICGPLSKGSTPPASSSPAAPTMRPRPAPAAMPDARRPSMPGPRGRLRRPAPRSTGRRPGSTPRSAARTAWAGRNCRPASAGSCRTTAASTAARTRCSSGLEWLDSISGAKLPGPTRATLTNSCARWSAACGSPSARP